jgi:hypothetical protein
MGGDELLEAVLGFPVRRKVAIPGLLGGPKAAAFRRVAIEWDDQSGV